MKLFRDSIIELLPESYTTKFKLKYTKDGDNVIFIKTGTENLGRTDIGVVAHGIGFTIVPFRHATELVTGWSAGGFSYDYSVYIKIKDPNGNIIVDTKKTNLKEPMSTSASIIYVYICDDTNFTDDTEYSYKIYRKLEEGLYDVQVTISSPVEVLGYFTPSGTIFSSDVGTSYIMMYSSRQLLEEGGGKSSNNKYRHYYCRCLDSIQQEDYYPTGTIEDTYDKGIKVDMTPFLIATGSDEKYN